MKKKIKIATCRSANRSLAAYHNTYRAPCWPGEAYILHQAQPIDIYNSWLLAWVCVYSKLWHMRTIYSDKVPWASSGARRGSDRPAFTATALPCAIQRARPRNFAQRCSAYIYKGQLVHLRWSYSKFASGAYLWGPPAAVQGGGAPRRNAQGQRPGSSPSRINYGEGAKSN